MKSMEWSKESCLNLIDEYHKHPVLWDPKHDFYLSKKKKLDAWKSISYAFKMDVRKVKQKMDSLLGSFRREKSKFKNSVGNGKSRQDIYVSKWFAFSRMQFLLDREERHMVVSFEDVAEDLERETEISEFQGLQHSRHLLEYSEVTESEFNELANVDVSVKQRLATKAVKRPRRHEDGRLEQHFEDPRPDEPYEMLQNSPPTVLNSQPDYCTTYGQYVGNKLRTYNMKTRSFVEHAINNILFEADMGKYDASQVLYPHSYPQNYCSVQVASHKTSASTPSPSSTNNTSTPCSSVIATSSISGPSISADDFTELTGLPNKNES